MANSDGALSHTDLAVEFADVEVVVEGETFKESAMAMARSSPIFDAMLRSDMKEGQTKHIEFPGKSKQDYYVFRNFISPRCVSMEDQKITTKNVDVVLPWFHEYQMTPMLKECDAFLMTQDVTVKRLHQAHMYDLDDQYARCLKEVSERLMDMELEDLRDNPKVMQALIEQRFPEMTAEVLRDNPEQALLLAVQKAQKEQREQSMNVLVVAKCEIRSLYGDTNMTGDRRHQALVKVHEALHGA